MPRRLLLCDLKDAKVIRGGALSIKNATGYYQFFERASRCLFFSDLSCLYLGRRSFYYICGQFVLHLSVLLHLWIHPFLAIQCNRNNLAMKCEKHNLRKSGKLVKKNFENLRRMEWLS